MWDCGLSLPSDAPQDLLNQDKSVTFSYCFCKIMHEIVDHSGLIELDLQYLNLLGVALNILSKCILNSRQLKRLTFITEFVSSRNEEIPFLVKCINMNPNLQ